MPRLEGFKMWEMKVTGKKVQDSVTFTKSVPTGTVFSDSNSLRTFLKGLGQQATADERYEARIAVSDMCAWATLHELGIGTTRIWSDIYDARIENRGTCVVAVAALCEAISAGQFPEVSDMNRARANMILLDLEVASTGGPACGIHRFADSVVAEDEVWEYEDIDE